MSMDLNELGLRLESNYFEDEKLRQSFNKLAMKTFSLDFESFYKEKLYFKRYTAYSVVKDDTVIANVSASRFNLIVERTAKKAIQLGTIMTDEEYRGKGLSRVLMEHIIKEFENTHDLIFLYSNKLALDFYPKFGFERMIETHYEIEAGSIARKPVKIVSLDMKRKQDAFILSNIMRARAAVSRTVGVVNDKWPVIAHINTEDLDCDYIVDDDTIVVGKKIDGKYHIYDILSRKAIEINNVIEKLNLDNVDTLHFYFPVKSYKYSFIGVQHIDDDDALFVRSREPLCTELTFSPLDKT